jgi:membrane protease YdiL (CAAX protease family)
LNEERSSLDIWDILLLIWMVATAVIWISPLVSKSTGKAGGIVMEVGMLAIALLYLSQRRFPIAETFRWKGVQASLLPWMLLAGISGAILLDGLDRIVGILMPLPEENLQSLIESLTSSTRLETVLILAGLVVVGPFVEESLFRGAIQSGLEKRLDVTRGVMLTALIFSLVHLQFYWLIQLMAMSFYLGWLSWKFDSIVPALILHSANNLFSYLMMMQPKSWFSTLLLSDQQLNPLIAALSLATFIISTRLLSRSTDDSSEESETYDPGH